MCLLCISFPQSNLQSMWLFTQEGYIQIEEWEGVLSDLGFKPTLIHGYLQIPLWVLWEQMVWSWVPIWIHIIEGSVESKSISMVISLVSDLTWISLAIPHHTGSLSHEMTAITGGRAKWKILEVLLFIKVVNQSSVLPLGSCKEYRHIKRKSSPFVAGLKVDYMF